MAFLCTEGRPAGINIVDLDTGERRVLLTDTVFTEPALEWSPDGKRIAFPTGTGIAVIDVDSGQLRRVSEDGKYLFRTISCLRWAPGGNKILFISNYATKDGIKGTWTLFVLDVNTGHETMLAEEVRWGCPAWSPDGKEIAFISAAHPDAKYRQYGQIFKLDLDTGKVTQLTDEPGLKDILRWGEMIPRPDGY